MIFDDYLKEFRDFKSKLSKFPDYLLKDSSFEPVLKKNWFRIVVVGGVGVGKSSVLERLTGVRLPKGLNSCTRRPVIINLDNESTLAQFKDFDSVGIITSDPITNYSTNNLHNEFIDLPGLASMSRPDQPENYPQLTRELIEFHTAEADVILLCLPVDADLVNSDALKLVKALDIDHRVVCCLTKLDLLTETLNLESTRTFSGVISLRNAPLLEMSESIPTTNKKEVEFFKSFDDSFSFGIENVKSEIVKILKKDFNQMKNEISSRLWREKIKLERQMKSMRDPNFTLKLVTDYIDHVSKEISGTAEEHELTVGTRIGLIFWKNLPEALDSIDILKGIDREHLRILIKNSQGLRASFQFENAFKILLKSQLKLSETIIFDCLNLISRELRNFLIIPGETLVDEEDEFYDVKSVSDTESEEGDFEDVQNLNFDTWSLKSQLKLIPSLAKSINKTLSRILEDSQRKTRKYLEEYCAMQREMVFCNDPEYIEAFRTYLNGGTSEIVNKEVSKRASSANLDNIADRNTISSFSRNSSYYSASSISDDLPLKRIQSESLETLTKGKEEETSGFLKEFLALLFPNPNVQNVKRVEYRPKKRLVETAKDSGNTTNSRLIAEPIVIKQSIVTPSASRDEEFLLKLLKIYLKSHHTQLKDFLPKCINYHLIQETLKQLPLKLLTSVDNTNCSWIEEVKRIERVMKMIGDIEEK